MQGKFYDRRIAAPDDRLRESCTYRRTYSLLHAGHFRHRIDHISKSTPRNGLSTLRDLALSVICCLNATSLCRIVTMHKRRMRQFAQMSKAYVQRPNYPVQFYCARSSILIRQFFIRERCLHLIIIKICVGVSINCPLFRCT